MRVLRPGTKFEPFEINCGHCMAGLMIEELSDMTSVSGSDFRESWYYLNVKCPECGRLTQIDINRVPAHLRDQIKPA